MNYKLTNFMIKEANGNRISGLDNASEYLTCSAFNPMNRFEKSHNIAIFDRGTVEYYKNILPKSRGGILPDEGWSEANMDNMDKVFLNGIMYEYDLGGWYCRKYTADIIDSNGNPIQGKRQGDIICNQNGTPIIFNKISVFCQYQFKTEPLVDQYGMPRFSDTGIPLTQIVRDKDGRPIESWVAGWSPAEVGESMRRLLTPYNDAMAVAPEIQQNGTPLDNFKQGVEDLLNSGEVQLNQNPAPAAQPAQPIAQPAQPAAQPGTTATVA